ncbi:MAG: hypothetical protein NZM38_01635 [Cytophagales bacterium]|nr:hypothetical protein [Cytophagales bacterium]MDW8383453.1 hypothetical protein [Flammeovirgaceae bacterium]
MLQDAYLALCKKEIEEIFGYGSSEAWTHRNFVDLSEKIYQKTGIQLSTSTLKRIWGKIKPLDRPHHTTTLDALAMYLGYTNWSDYKEKKKHLVSVDTRVSNHSSHSSSPVIECNNDVTLEKERDEILENKSKKKGTFIGSKRLIWLYGFIALCVIGIATIVFVFFRRDYETAPVFFRHKYLTSPDSLPVSILFQFDIRHLMNLPKKVIAFGDGSSYVIKLNDTEMIHQFYREGYYPVRLYINEEIKAFIPLTISTKQWYLQLVTDRGNPVEIKRQPVKDTLLGFSVEKYKNETEKLITHYKLAIESLSEYDLDNLVFEADFKSFILEKIETPRYFLQIRLQGDVESIFLQFKSYYNRGYNRVSEKDITNDVAEKSVFMQSFQDWKKMTISTQKNQFTVLEDNVPIYQTSYKKPLGRLRQIEITLSGVGQIRNLKLK